MELLIDNWVLFMFLGGVSIFVGLILSLQEHSYFKTKLKMLISNIGWYIFIPIGIIFYVISIVGIVARIVSIIIL